MSQEWLDDDSADGPRADDGRRAVSYLVAQESEEYIARSTGPRCVIEVARTTAET